MPIELNSNVEMPEVEVGRVSSVPQQLAEQIRELIYSGAIPEGSKLPSNKELSDKWQVGRASIQSAMAKLVKEGLLQRARKRGTFVTQRSQTLTRAGIYLTEDVWQMPHAAFRRQIVQILLDQLRQRDVEPQLWIDPRPRKDQGEPWADLLEAAKQRRVQAVLLPDFTVQAIPWIRRLPVAHVVYSALPLPNFVGFDIGFAEQLAVEELARQGCRSVGLVANLTADTHSQNPSDRIFAQSIEAFKQTAAKQNLETREQWISHPMIERVSEGNSEQYGYEATRHLLEMPQRPEGIYVTHDVVARGAVLALLESKVRVPHDLKLVLHRNAEISLLCPLKASFVDYSVADIATAMLKTMDAEMKGQEVPPVKVRPRLRPATD